MLGEHHNRNTGLASTEGLAVWRVLLRAMDCGNSRFESLWAHVLSYLVFAVCCVYRSMRSADHSFRGVLPSVCVSLFPISFKMRRPRPKLGRWTTNTQQSVGLSPQIILRYQSFLRCHTLSFTVHILFVNKHYTVQYI
jgi:hypothetical protein